MHVTFVVRLMCSNWRTSGCLSNYQRLVQRLRSLVVKASERNVATPALASIGSSVLSTPSIATLCYPQQVGNPLNQ